MKFFRRITCIAAAVAGCVLLSGCDSVTALKTENQQLQANIMRQEQANQRLMAQLERLRSRPEGADPVEIERLEIEINKRDRQLSVMRRALQQMQGQIALSEQLEHKLQALADELGGELVGNRLMLPCDYFFASGRYDLMPDGKKKLQKFAQVLKDDKLMLMIVGHTDSDPIKHARKRNITTNLELSLFRAMAVLEELKKSGYPGDMMYPTGWGDMRPVAPNDSARNKQLNRRVEIYVDPTASGLMNASAITSVEPVVSQEIINTPSTTVDIITDGGPVTSGN